VIQLVTEKRSAFRLGARLASYQNFPREQGHTATGGELRGVSGKPGGSERPDVAGSGGGFDLSTPARLR